MSTYVLIHGGGGVASHWDFVAAELRDRGHDVVAVDLPIEDESAGLNEYADAVVEAIGGAGDRDPFATTTAAVSRSTSAK